MLKPEVLNGEIYKNTLTELRLAIENTYPSLLAFAKEHKFDDKNLYKCFNQYGGQDMSVGLFSRIVSALGYAPAANINNSNLSLRSYLEIDNNAVFKSIMFVNYSIPKKIEK